MYAIKDLSSRGHAFLFLNITTPLVACIAVGLRIWIRVFISKSVGAEDWLLVSSVVSHSDEFC